MRIQEIILEQTQYPEWFTWLQRYEQRWRVDPEYSMLQQLGLDANSTPEQVQAIRGADISDALRELGNRYRAFAKPARFKPQQWLRQTQLYHQLGHMQQGLIKRFREPDNKTSSMPAITVKDTDSIHFAKNDTKSPLSF